MTCPRRIQYATFSAQNLIRSVPLSVPQAAAVSTLGQRAPTPRKTVPDRASSSRHRESSVYHSSALLCVQRVHWPIPVIALDVRVHVGPVLAGVHAVGALEPRRLTALVLEMPVKTAVPFVRLLALGAIEVAPRRGVHHRQQAPGVVTAPPPIRSHSRRVWQGGQVERHCKVQGSLLSG